MNERMHDAELCGFLSYCALAAHGRLVKDAYMAPDSVQLVDLVRMSQGALEAFEEIAAYCEKSGYDLYALMAPATGLYDEMESRLRPGNWAERVVKTYIVFGILSDCIEAALTNTDLPVAKLQNLSLWEFGHGSWARALIKALAASDTQMSQLLSLWGRRVFGEGLGMVRGFITRYPDVAPLIGSDEAAIVQMVQERHQKRMADCGLAS